MHRFSQTVLALLLFVALPAPPALAQAPDLVEAPASTQAPALAQAPVRVQTPPLAQAPASTQASALALAPGIAQAPALAQIPGTTQAAALAQAPSDTTRPMPPFFTYRDAVLLGLFGAGVLALNPLDRHFATRLQDPNNQSNRFLHGASTFFRLMGQPAPQIIAVGLYGVGRVSHNVKIEKLAVHGAEAMLLSTVATTTIKVLAGRARPYRDTTKSLGFKFGRGLPHFLGGEGAEFQSFPSGHATTAFAVASAATAEFSHWADEWHSPSAYKVLVGSVLYGGATLVGISRMYNNAHWASDVLAGAAIGTFAGIKTVRYNYRNPNNKIERWLVKVQVVPGHASVPTMVGVGLGAGAF